MSYKEKLIKDTKDQIAVMEAFIRGEVIECMDLEDETENYIETEAPLWDWCHYDYRVQKMRVGDVGLFWINLEFKIARVYKDNEDGTYDVYIAEHPDGTPTAIFNANKYKKL